MKKLTASSGPGVCPECGGDDINVDSSSSMRLSEISCGDCAFKMQAKVCEETLVKRWNKLGRSNPDADHG